MDANFVGFKTLFRFLLGAAQQRLIAGKDFKLVPHGALMMITPISMRAWDLMDEVLGF